MGDVALVTGAHGFIGRHVAQALAARGADVLGIGHGGWSPEEQAAWGIRHWLPSDVSPASLKDLPRPPAVIIHCAGGASVARALADPFDDFVRSVETSAAVLEYARSAGSVPRVVLASSVSVYGSVGTDRATEERTPRPASPYAAHKLLAERLGTEYGRIFGVPGAIVRLPSVYGPGLRRQLLWDACRRLSAGEGTFAGTGRESRDWLHVADAVELLLTASDRATPGWPVVNGGTGTPATVEEVVRLAAETLGGPAPTFSGVARAGDPEHLVPDVSRALSWGWRPGTGWRAGVRAYCEWYRAGQR